MPELDPFSATFFDDPYPTYRALRDEAPVYHNERYGFWALSRFDDVVAAHRDWQTFSSAHGVTLSDMKKSERPFQSIITMDPPEHDRMRKLVSRVFTPRAVQALEPLVRDVVGGYLDAVDGRDGFDAVVDFSAPFPIEVIATVVGVPKADRQLVRERTDLMLHREDGREEMTQEGMEAAAGNFVFFHELVAERRQHPADDMTSRLCEVEVERDDGTTTRLTDEEIAGFVSLLTAAGAETVTKLVGGGVVLFARHPSEWQKLVDDPGRAADAVEEALRYWPPSQYQGRYTAKPATFEGGTIPEGQPVFLLTGAATRDERAYPDPDRFDLDREQKLGIALGHGVHACLGAALARLEGRVAFEELARRFPRYEVDEDNLQRVHMSNVAGYSSVPVAVTG